MIKQTELRALLGWRDLPTMNLDFGNFSRQPNEALRSKLLELPSETKTVLGIDIFKYSKMDEEKQLLVPFLLDEFLVASANILKGAKYLFQKKSALDVVHQRIDTGDGCFLVFDTPIHAIIFSTVFETIVRFFNSYSIFPETRALVGTLTYRLAMVTDKVYMTEFENGRSNVYGKGIILCSRAISRDKLNRFLLDDSTFSWFVENLKGIENLAGIDLTQLSLVPDFANYSSELIDQNNILINSESYDERESKIESVEVLKLFETSEKKDTLNLYCIHVRAKVSVESRSRGKKYLLRVSLGNLNTEGITF